jgi:isopentenyl-diphosphate delta-isomerase
LSAQDSIGTISHPPAALAADDLILVDDADQELGHLSKAECHRGSGVLHRAFSLFIFDAHDHLLLQRRSEAKPLWPMYWSNSCCSHPRRGESMQAATHRRLFEELGLHCPLRFLFKFRYQAQFDHTAAEHELCSVFFGRSAEPVCADPREIAEWRWISQADLRRELASSGEHFTPWFMLEWARIARHHLDDIASHQGTRAWASR